ncbi:MAG: HipA domain-containing protein [Sutterellaceae bacterium]|nr:HipA domain-containing protein [Sutterellaceae bacterium]
MYEIKQIERRAFPNLETSGKILKWWQDGKEWMVKIPDDNRRDECWTEKCACELCNIMEIPHAEYQLCCITDAFGGRKFGVMTKKMMHSAQQLAHGNELLSEWVPGYQFEMTKSRGNSLYTLENVFYCLDALDKRYGRNDRESAKTFCLYLLLDTLIGNQDRHHMNWGIIWDEVQAKQFLAPSFDHAASLGRGLSDTERESRLESKDSGFSVDRFAQRAKTMFVDDTGKKLSTLNCLVKAIHLCPEARQTVLESLGLLNRSNIEEVLSNIPEELCSSVAKKFALELIAVNIERVRSNV